MAPVTIIIRPMVEPPEISKAPDDADLSEFRSDQGYTG
eukprot:CAMPEP_0198301842 /NCGR_PEP_ID=MMETSP1449-20131203/53118_1 /TAXON_ID=420275 /ORGANISM="Attheya septentrionalis, Strain CCMP2084" /LENGTH=37 /DNA_ID= /DNA_START= /DNA_END= /DNA_ORIENTATION=